MNITVNGEILSIEVATTVRELIASQAPMCRAIAVNGSVVPASAHETTQLADGDAVEIVTAVAGG